MVREQGVDSSVPLGSTSIGMSLIFIGRLTSRAARGDGPRSTMTVLYAMRKILPKD